MKIIQITATSGGADNGNDFLYALTDDGRLFALRFAESVGAYEDRSNWVQLPPIPKSVIKKKP